MPRWERWVLVAAVLAFVVVAFGSVTAVLVASAKLVVVYLLVAVAGEIACFVRNRHVTHQSMKRKGSLPGA